MLCRPLIKLLLMKSPSVACERGCCRTLARRAAAARSLQEASGDVDQQWEDEERRRYSARADGISTAAGGAIDYVGEHDSP